MSCCCTKVYKFCKPLRGCSASDFANLFKGLAEGTYSVQLDFLSGKQLRMVTVKDSIILVSGGDLNESYTYTGQVFDSGGNVVPLVFETLSYDCFQFETKIFLQ